jgi:hypothetical protein
VLFRAVLLPLSDDGGVHINYVLGAANFRKLLNSDHNNPRTQLQRRFIHSNLNVTIR